MLAPSLKGVGSKRERYLCCNVYDDDDDSQMHAMSGTGRLPEGAVLTDAATFVHQVVTCTCLKKD